MSRSKGASNIAIIGTCTSGIMYLSGLPALVLNRMHPRLSRWSPTVGLLITCLSLALSSLATTVTQLVATQGVLCAVGGSIGYLPCILYMDEWFVRRKGLAYGIMWSGTGLAGAILPLLLEDLLSAYGH
ncbi:putative major facilitator superfamily transporter [Diaporthe ampelina]|uniref:Putative major facilitator superfamily transporter n=1 Tax=Diaporthe ampelina TaxID=1214573 RepID=A0A0G2H7J1_9PEZI|nr:putative major facilitator superfamily transporter [Diaporthe ampelina]